MYTARVRFGTIGYIVVVGRVTIAEELDREEALNIAITYNNS